MIPTHTDLVELRQEAELARVQNRSLVVVKAEDLLAILNLVQDQEDEINELYRMGEEGVDYD